MENLSSRVLLAMPMLIPPLEEQAEIAREVLSYRDHAASLVARLSLQEGLLFEHRQALITAAVTGQINLAGEAA